MVGLSFDGDDMDLNNIFPTWRFTPVHDKRPYLPSWQDMPFPHRDIKHPQDGYGLILGQHSGGVMALDFDGGEAWEFYRQQFGPLMTETLSWTSGKLERMQSAYWVPESHWGDLSTIKVGPGGKLEFRWTGSQSVIPPSSHPETGSYSWADEPRSPGDVADLPAPLLDFWLSQCRRDVIRPPAMPSRPPEPRTITEEKINKLLEVIRLNVGRPDYDTWLRLSFAVAKEIGAEDAGVVMAGFFPEEKAGEYRRLFRQHQPGESPGIGTLVYEARRYDECKFLHDYWMSGLSPDEQLARKIRQLAIEKRQKRIM